MGKKKDSGVVKIDVELLERVEKFISKDSNKYKYVNKKQFIDLAVFEYLKNLDEKEGGNEKK
ncbi:hypothetical protein GOV12_00265 [Candidatus Pacearchaeota archaeon]|nr:hypothetical protein [Candidatus Pacearchaeota archaeon]